MKTNKLIPPLFIVAAIYDGLLGAVFLLGGSAVFEWFAVEPPNHLGYVQFSAALLMIFAVMFMAIARNSVKNRGLILYGILLKVSYCGVVLYHWVAAGIPGMWKPFCIFDLVFLGLFVWAWKVLAVEPEVRSV